MRVFSGIYSKEIIEKDIKIVHLKTKARYKFIIALFGLPDR